MKTPATEKSARTSTCLKITRGHIRSTHIYLRMRKEAQSSIFLQQCLVTQSHAASHFLSLTRLEVIFIFFTTRKRAVRHFIHFSQKSSEPKQFISTVAQLRPEKLRAQIKCQQLRDSCVMPDPSLIASTWWQFSEKLKCIPTYLHSQILEQKIHQPNEYKNIIINK